MSNLANNTVTMEEILALVQSLPEGGGGGFPNGTEWTLSNITGSSVSRFCYANGIWVAAGTELRYSVDGKTWISATPTSDADYFCDFTAVAYANGIWVAVGGGAWRSTDGMTWSPSPSTTDFDWEFDNVVYGGGLWLASLDSWLSTSSDGLVWSEGYDFESSILDIMYEYSLYITCTAKGIYYSTDAETWTKATGPGSARGEAICYGAGVFVAATWVGLYYSLDGKTWTLSNITSGRFYAIGYANGLFVAGGNATGLYYSLDGRTWTQSNVTSGVCRAICNANGIWVAGHTATGLYYSADGKVWTQSNIRSGNYRTICNANGIWVTGGKSDSSNVYYSVGWEPS